MHSSLSEADRWESGCASDSTRNEFIVPTLRRHFERYRPASILDIGAGTGYIARAVDRELSYRPDWTLIDICPERLDLATRLIPEDMSAHTIAADVLTHQFVAAFEAVVVTFTLLEMSDLDRILSVFRMTVTPKGHLFVGMPDAWIDVVAQESGPVLEEYLGGNVSIPKVDRFTGNSYPFQAIRTESLIAQVLSTGFELLFLEEGGGAGHRSYMLTFRRREA